jgi:hypothetical protein
MSEAVAQVGYKAVAFLANLRDEDVEAMPPARREELGNLCAYWAARVKARPPAKAGVLSELRNGARD